MAGRRNCCGELTILILVVYNYVKLSECNVTASNVGKAHHYDLYNKPDLSGNTHLRESISPGKNALIKTSERVLDLALLVCSIRIKVSSN